MIEDKLEMFKFSSILNWKDDSHPWDQQENLIQVPLASVSCTYMITSGISKLTTVQNLQQRHHWERRFYGAPNWPRELEEYMHRVMQVIRAGFTILTLMAVNPETVSYVVLAHTKLYALGDDGQLAH